MSQPMIAMEAFQGSKWLIYYAHAPSSNLKAPYPFFSHVHA